MTTHIVRYVNLCHLFIYIQQWKKCETLHIQSSLGIYAHKHLRKCKDTYFILQNNIVLEQRSDDCALPRYFINTDNFLSIPYSYFRSHMVNFLPVLFILI